MTTVDDQCIELYEAIKIRRKFRWVTYKIKDLRVIVDKTGDPEDRLDKFLAALPGSNSRFALYDYEYYADSNKQRKASKLLFIQWIPENANDRDRVTYTQAQSVFKPKLSGIFVHSIVNKSDLRTIVVDEA